MGYLYRKSDEYSLTITISQTFIEIATAKDRQYSVTELDRESYENIWKLIKSHMFTKYSSVSLRYSSGYSFTIFTSGDLQIGWNDSYFYHRVGESNGSIDSVVIKEVENHLEP